jgi:hypothetical protein
VSAPHSPNSRHTHCILAPRIFALLLGVLHPPSQHTIFSRSTGYSGPRWVESQNRSTGAENDVDARVGLDDFAELVGLEGVGRVLWAGRGMAKCGEGEVIARGAVTVGEE